MTIDKKVKGYPTVAWQSFWVVLGALAAQQYVSLLAVCKTNPAAYTVNIF